VVSSETRNADPVAAGAAVARILSAQQARGNQLLFKKVDSTLRGPFAAEVRALIETLAAPLVAVCPANPAVGRTVRDGLLLVRGMPVAETEFRQDPGWPVRESKVANLLAAGGVTPVTSLFLGELRSLTALGPQHRRGVLVSDAETRDDLEQLVRLVRQSEPAAVFVGAGGLAHTLAASEAGQGSVEWKVPATVLIVSGSKNSQSRRQLELLRDRHAVALYELEAGPERDAEIVAGIARALAERGAASLTIAKKFLAPEAGAPVQRLTEVVKRLFGAGAEPQMLAATGGETAQAICVALGVNRLELVSEIEPGVVVTRVSGDGRGNLSAIVIKPGGFGSNEIWADIIPHRRQ
jgi:uncharacterized protein YgbK (DUF1537 family)